jgi:hypothetical protein
MKYLSHFVLVLLSLCLISEASFAQKKSTKKKSDRSAPEAEEGSGNASYRGASYGMAGCGFGGYAVAKNTKLAQMGASTLNGYSSNQSSAISSGTSNCDKLPESVTMMEQEVFISSNLDSLSREAAQGHGEHLVAFAELLGCNQDKELTDAFARMSQRNHEQLFVTPQGAAKDILSQVKSAIRSDEVLSGNCSRS